MAISLVRVQINGTWHTLTSTDGTTFTGTITAPGATSYNLTGGYYDVTVEATNSAGTVATQNGSGLAGLQLKVKETIPPVITIVTPSAGAYVTNNKQKITFTVIDETGGSGVDYDSVEVKVDGTVVSGVARILLTNGIQFSYTPTTALSDGSHTVTVNCSDFDGNAAVEKSISFTVDTVPPTLNVSAPTNALETNAASLVVRGNTNDSTSSPVTVRITLGGTDQGAITVASDGTFSKTLTLAEGSNTIVVTATDSAGKTSSVTRTVVLNTSVPVIKSAVISPNPVNTGASMIITVVVE